MATTEETDAITTTAGNFLWHDTHRVEIIHKPRSTSLQVCLVKTGTTTPLISALELRPLRIDTYVPQSGSLKKLFRVYLTDSKDTIRYPEDVHDRLWSPFFMPERKLLRTSLLSVNTSDNEYELPGDVLVTAATPANVSSPFSISWNEETSEDLLYAYLHVTEIQSLKGNDTREFKISAGQNVSYGPVSPEKSEVYNLFNTSPVKCEGWICNLQLIRTPNSTLPPLLNAIDAFITVEFPQTETHANDVVAIKSIEISYGLSRISWQGDPCVPQQFLWDGLTCEYTNMYTPPRIHSLLPNVDDDDRFDIVSQSRRKISLKAKQKPDEVAGSGRGRGRAGRWVAGRRRGGRAAVGNHGGGGGIGRSRPLVDRAEWEGVNADAISLQNRCGCVGRSRPLC
ncbi:unnamed protein product [Microthlaspi erraticum]|uniref:Malectin-like domain-containing protein n=1 Tax=Microthlaspi erraticum TaxID=1685480 RepID=A0A6D2L1I0_9BRAS|nr:unnamed protein product [Microthlaspi erraticum]